MVEFFSKNKKGKVILTGLFVHLYREDDFKKVIELERGIMDLINKIGIGSHIEKKYEYEKIKEDKI